MRNRDLLILIA